ncbi:MAG TPA: membrane protein insertion efficiency factor YidD [bacterium]|nr:membrane protein insertion efficiency factor YidD [bacterium]
MSIKMGRLYHKRPISTPALIAFKSLILGSIRLYQIGISPAFPRRCRFYPSCSTYALEAVQRYGAWKGMALAVRRLLRCHPFHAGGYDPVP